MADRSKSIESNSPRPRKNFKPAVKTNPPSGEAREDEEYEEWEHGREEHENDDERDRERREYGEFDHEE